MIVTVCFVEHAYNHWWDWFTSEFSHCFLLLNIDGNIYKLDDRFNGTRITKPNDCDFKHKSFSFVIEEPKLTLWIPTFTCAGFCAKFLGLSGLIITPRQLHRRLRKWVVYSERRQFKQQHQKN